MKELQGGPTRLDGITTRRPERSQRFDRAVTVLGYLNSLAPERSVRGRHRIDQIVLALAAPRLQIGTRDLEHRYTRQGQMAGNARTVAAGGFDTDPADVALRAQPREHGTIAGAGRREGLGAEHVSRMVHDRGPVQVLMSVDAANDGTGFQGRDGHIGSFGRTGVGTDLARTRTRQ